MSRCPMISHPDHATTYCPCKDGPSKEAYEARKVLKFKPRDNGLPPLWMCNCGSKKFALVEGGEIDCWDCGLTQSLKHAAPPPAGEKP